MIYLLWAGCSRTKALAYWMTTVSSKHAIALPLRQRRITLHEQYHQTTYTPHGSRYGAGFSISDADCFSWDTQKSTRFFKQSTISPGSSIFLRQHRIMGQRDSARDFDPSESMENAGILDVFPIFHTARLGQKIRRSPQLPLCGVALYYCIIIIALLRNWRYNADIM